jgi:transcriptional regulator GlxA family with amidase domain
MHRVVVLALDSVMPFELGIAGRVFGTASDDAGRPLYEVMTCSLSGRPVLSSLDFSIVVDHGPDALETADTVVIPPQGLDRACTPPPEPPDGLFAALGRIRTGTRIVSLCTAAFHLAAAGLLDDRPATTHWAFTADFAERFPHVALEPDVLFVDDGEVLTAAGAAAGIDLCLHLVRRDHGSETANQVARRCVVPPYRDGGQRQFVDRPTPAPLAATTEPTRAWALERLSQRLMLDELAAQSRMSVRNFTRRFREETGVSPNRWLARQRLDLARRLLEASDLPIEQIAAQTGFGSGTNFRQQFQRALGVAPSAYRRTFRVGPVPVPRPVT